MSAPDSIVRELLDELTRARGKHGLQHDLPVFGDAVQATGWLICGQVDEALARRHLDTDPSWVAILMEEVGEALQERNPVRFRDELVQAGAMIVALIDRLDNGEPHGLEARNG